MPDHASTIDLTLLAFHGTQAQTFLQGMATADVSKLTAQHGLPTLFCQYQGKLFASGYLFLGPKDCIYLLCSKAQALQASQQLTRYAQLSRVNLQTVPIHATCHVHKSAHNHTAYSLYTQAGRQWLTLSSHCQISWHCLDAPSDMGQPQSIAPSAIWLASLMQDGIVSIDDTLMLQFTPNQLGLVPSALVSLQKGCYCGQEIIARTHHLGKQTRTIAYLRCDIAHLPPNQLPNFTAGMPLTDGNSGKRMLVLAATTHAHSLNLQVAGDKQDLSATQVTIELIDGPRFDCHNLQHT